MENLFSHFSLGLIAGITPCLIAVIPIVSRILQTSKSRIITSLLRFLLGYFVSFAAVGLLANAFFASSWVVLVKLLIASFFFWASLEIFAGRLNLARLLPPKSIPFLGLGFPWLAGLSPCVLPIVSLELVIMNSFSIINWLVFGVGLITPLVLFTIFGSLAFATGKAGKLANKVYTLASPVLILFTSLYLVLTNFPLSSTEIALAWLVVAAVFIWQVSRPGKLNSKLTMVFAFTWLVTLFRSLQLFENSVGLTQEDFAYACLQHNISAEYWQFALLWLAMVFSFWLAKKADR